MFSGRPLYGATAKRSVLRGEVDAFSADVLAQVLRGLPATDEVIDVSLLFFVDGRGAWTLHDEVSRRRGSTDCEDGSRGSQWPDWSLDWAASVINVITCTC